MASTLKPEWEKVRRALDKMQQSLDATSLNMATFGHAYEELTQNIFLAAQAEGLTTLRAEAAAKALNLQTKRSQLLAFIEK